MQDTGPQMARSTYCKYVLILDPIKKIYSKRNSDIQNTYQMETLTNTIY